MMKGITKVNSARAIRQRFVDYFSLQHRHQVVKSSSLIPDGNDGSLLFTNAGMNQFKDFFLGNVKPTFQSATSVQRCLRAGGKHNDLDNVGFTPRHHTLFEMMGNFSFGQYFKEESIVLAWDFIRKELEIPSDKLLVTVFEQDVESEKLWKSILSKEENHVPVLRKDAQENFWSMGDEPNLPCGPCTEIFVKVPGHDEPLEIWNLVFMQFLSGSDGSLGKLPVPCVDTGMGLERVASVLQGVENNWETDVFAPLVSSAHDFMMRSATNEEFLKTGFPQRVVADHARAAACLVADGVAPGAVGRGYILRKIIRRATGFAHRAGCREPVLDSLLPAIAEYFGETFPELDERKAAVSAVLRGEEEAFFKTLDKGSRILDAALGNSVGKELDPATVFQLYDTFGFPVELTRDAARERGLYVDIDKFDQLMVEQRHRSESGSSFSHQTESPKWASSNLFTGYTNLVETNATVTNVAPVMDGELQWISISPCPFYPTGGGQECDQGVVSVGQRNYPVVSTQRLSKECIGLLINVGTHPELNQGDIVSAQVDKSRRLGCQVHHTATHLLHAALRAVIGEQVMQAGSLVNDTRLRFDFTHPRPISVQEVSCF